MASELEKRRWLFPILSANLAQFVPKLAGLFACPICGKIFKAEAIEEPVEVDLAHVYPDSCGGNIATLSCKPCNSRIGGVYDGQLAVEQRTHDLMAGKGGAVFKASVRFEAVPDAVINGEITSDGNGFRFKEIPGNSNPAHVAKITQAMKNTPPGKLVPIFKFKPHDPTRVSISLLHAAYMALFERLGYSYLYYSDTQWVRDILTAVKPPPYAPVHIVSVLTEDLKLPDGVKPQDVMHWPGYIWLDDGTRCMGVPFPSPTERFQTRVVMMPGLGDDGAADWKKLQARPSGDITCRFTTEIGGLRQEDLADPQYRDFWLYRWNHVKHSET